MLTGISGSNTVEIASMIAGFSAAVLSGIGGELRSVVDSGAAPAASASGIMGKRFHHHSVDGVAARAPAPP